MTIDFIVLRFFIPLGTMALLSFSCPLVFATVNGMRHPQLRVSMMSGNMMGPGMMGSGSSESSDNGNSPSKPITLLNDYVKSQQLNCFSCHSITRTKMAPSFIEIAHHYSGTSKAEHILSTSINRGVTGRWPGYGGMPSGMANLQQSHDLAKLILELVKK